MICGASGCVKRFLLHSNQLLISIYQGENKAGNLIVRIPENVGWREVGKRKKVSYVVEFSTSDDRVFMIRKGSCWHEKYAKCANQILNEAKIAARKLPR